MSQERKTDPGASSAPNPVSLKLMCLQIPGGGLQVPPGLRESALDRGLQRHTEQKAPGHRVRKTALEQTWEP